MCVGALTRSHVAKLVVSVPDSHAVPAPQTFGRRIWVIVRTSHHADLVGFGMFWQLDEGA